MHPYGNQSENYVKYVLRITYPIVIFTYHVLRIATYSRIDMGMYFYVSRIYVLRIATYLRITYRIRHMKGIVLRKTHVVAHEPRPMERPMGRPMGIRMGRPPWDVTWDVLWEFPWHVPWDVPWGAPWKFLWSVQWDAPWVTP